MKNKIIKKLEAEKVDPSEYRHQNGDRCWVFGLSWWKPSQDWMDPEGELTEMPTKFFRLPPWEDEK